MQGLNMNLSDQQELALMKKTELFLRRSNEKLELRLKQSIYDVFIKQANELIKKNNIQIKLLMKTIYSMATTER
jgi:hypothetical protein